MIPEDFKQLLRSVIDGVIEVDADDIRHITSLINRNQAYADLHRFNNNSNQFEMIRRVYTTDAKIDEQLQAAADRPRGILDSYFYSFVCCRSTGEAAGTIYSPHINIF